MLKTQFKNLIVCAIGAAVSMLLTSSCQAAAHPQPKSSASALETSLKRYLQVWDGDESKKTRYIAAFRDLNGDGKDEAIVFVISNGLCRSGGDCPTLVLKQTGRSWEIVSKIMVTRPPIRVATATSNGWHNIGVWVLGGEGQSGYEAELRFDGKAYPRNAADPSLPRLEGESAGEVVIRSAKDAVPLYE